MMLTVTVKLTQMLTLVLNGSACDATEGDANSSATAETNDDEAKGDANANSPVSAERPEDEQ